MSIAGLTALSPPVTGLAKPMRNNSGFSDPVWLFISKLYSAKRSLLTYNWPSASLAVIRPLHATKPLNKITVFACTVMEHIPVHQDNKAPEDAWRNVLQLMIKTYQGHLFMWYPAAGDTHCLWALLWRQIEKEAVPSLHYNGPSLTVEELAGHPSGVTVASRWFHVASNTRITGLGSNSLKADQCLPTSRLWRTSTGERMDQNPSERLRLGQAVVTDEGGVSLWVKVFADHNMSIKDGSDYVLVLYCVPQYPNLEGLLKDHVKEHVWDCFPVVVCRREENNHLRKVSTLFIYGVDASKSASSDSVTDGEAGDQAAIAWPKLPY